ncbi:MAG: hypothetical protein OWP43_00020 [Sphaerochaetaceae bacterium]|nr:hypothetical protein [Sphaerochaetaceae bacterium]
MTKENFFPSEELIYEALYSNSRKINKKYLISKLKEKGIYVSNNDDPELILKYYSKLIHGYTGFATMLEDVSTKPKGEKTTSVNIDIKPSDQNEPTKEISLTSMKDKFIKNIDKDNHDVVYTPHTDRETGNVTIDVEYSEIDYSKTKMIQRKHKVAVIELINENDSIKIRHTANEFIRKRVNKLSNIIEKEIELPIEKREIDFSGIANKNILTDFLTTLYAKIKILKPISVLSVKMIKPKNLDDNTSLDAEDDDINDEEVDEGINLNNAIFNGKNVITTGAYQNLKKNNYYVSSIKWESSIDEEDIKGKLEIIAKFNNHDEVSDFVYRVNGLYKYNSKRKSNSNYLRHITDKNICSRINNEIEIAAKEISEKLIGKYGGLNNG